jgi:DHA1 family bicyclomycin/chloramphenicol resistance-like MFS transporter
MMVFVTNASFIYQGYFELSEMMFGLAFAANTLGNIFINRINARLLNYFPAHQLLRGAIMLQGFFVLLLIVFTAIGVPIYIYLLGIVGAVGMLGAIMPNANAVYMTLFQENVGSASALLGAGQFLAGAVIGGLTTQFHNDTLWPVALTLLLLVIATNFLLPKAQKENTLEPTTNESA